MRRKKSTPKEILWLILAVYQHIVIAEKRVFLKIMSIWKNFTTMFDRIRGEEGEKREGEILRFRKKKVTIFWHLSLKLNRRKNKMQKNDTAVEHFGCRNAR